LGFQALPVWAVALVYKKTKKITVPAARPSRVPKGKLMPILNYKNNV